MFGSLFGTKKLKTLDIEPSNLDDNTVYLCKVHDYRGKPISSQELVEITGKELKILSNIHGIKKGMIKYSNELLYNVVEEVVIEEKGDS
ncbi:MAG TPA: hypothetical protein VK071_06185 [Tissierellales bacterium]|nr:hypothetical protein [Tissierellales bacterium]